MIIWVLFIIVVLLKFAPETLVWLIPFLAVAFAIWISAGLSISRRKR